MTDDPRRAIGGNNPPLNEAAKLEAEQALLEFAPRKQEFLDALGKIDIKNRGDAQLATDRVGLARDFLKIYVGPKRDELVKPYRDAQAAVSSTFANFAEDLLTAIGTGTGKISDYRNHVADMARKQQEEQRAAATSKPYGPSAILPPPPLDFHEAPAAKPKAAPLRGDLGKKVVARELKRAVLVDLSLVPDFIMQSQQVKTAIEAVATSLLKQFPNPAGFEITTTESVGVQ